MKNKKLEANLSMAVSKVFSGLNMNALQSPKFKEPIGALSKEQLEFWYDEVYQMCLLAVLRLEHVGRKKTFEALKSEIESKTP